MATHVYDLAYQADPPRLDFAGATPPEPLALQPGDRVVWRFLGAPAADLPSATFVEPESGRSSAFGPFLSLHTGHGCLVSEGFNGTRAGACEAWPVLLRWDAERLEVEALRSLRPLPLEAARSAGAAVETVRQVRLTLARRDGAYVVHVSPAEVAIGLGDVVEWQLFFADSDTAALPPFLSFFAVDGGRAGRQTSLGPFEDLQIESQGSLSALRYRILGSGNNGQPGRHAYAIGLLDPLRGETAVARLQPVGPDGRPIDDPVIDNSGLPPGG